LGPKGNRKNEIVGRVACVWKRRVTYRVLVGKPEIKRPLRRIRPRSEDSIKMDLKEMGWQAWNGSIWLRTGTGCGFLKRRQ